MGHEPELADRTSAAQVHLAESISDIAKDQREHSLRSRPQQPHPRGDDRERITRARQAAEALFRPKRAVEPSVPASLTPADQSARKPRVLGILPAAQIRHEELKTPVSREPQTTPEVPVSQFSRIRALVKYGMPVTQVAEIYRVAGGAIKRILRKA